MILETSPLRVDESAASKRGGRSAPPAPKKKMNEGKALEKFLKCVRQPPFPRRRHSRHHRRGEGDFLDGPRAPHLQPLPPPTPRTATFSIVVYWSGKIEIVTKFISALRFSQSPAIVVVNSTPLRSANLAFFLEKLLPSPPPSQLRPVGGLGAPDTTVYNLTFGLEPTVGVQRGGGGYEYC